LSPSWDHVDGSELDLSVVDTPVDLLTLFWGHWGESDSVRSSSSALIAALIGVAAAVVAIAIVVVLTIAITVTVLAASWPWAPVAGWFWFILTSRCAKREP
jgi:hypothetical protein